MTKKHSSAYFGRRKFWLITFVSVYRRYVSGFQNVLAVHATYRRDWCVTPLYPTTSRSR